MFSKVHFTLTGILEDIEATAMPMSSILGEQLIREWLTMPATFPSPLWVSDWFRLPWRAALYGVRVFMDWQECNSTAIWAKRLHLLRASLRPKRLR